MCVSYRCKNCMDLKFCTEIGNIATSNMYDIYRCKIFQKKFFENFDFLLFLCIFFPKICSKLLSRLVLCHFSRKLHLDLFVKCKQLQRKHHIFEKCSLSSASDSTYNKFCFPNSQKFFIVRAREVEFL